MIKAVVLVTLFALVSTAPQRSRNQPQANQRFPQPPQHQQPPPQQAQPQGPPPQQPTQGTQQQGQPAAPPPQISWGQCPQLEPTMEDKLKKSSVINKCLEITPIPENITRESVEYHREQVAACALQYEGWFNEKGTYKFEKAESEIKAKKLSKAVEEKVLGYHNQCKEEALEKYPAATKNLIAQIQLYQACMDYFISEVCGIEVSVPQPEYQ